jgi:hypothetical protein
MSLFLVAANTQNQNGGSSGAERAALFWHESAGWGTLYLSPFQSSVSFRFGTTQAENQIDYLRPSSVGSAFTISSAIKDGTTDSLFVNGTQVVNAGGKLATVAGCQAFGNVGRGYDNNTYYAGDIAEVLIYERALTAAERQGVERFLGSKYGLRLASLTELVGSIGLRAPRIIGIWMEQGDVRLDFSGQAGKGYQIEASEDLTRWTVVGHVTMGPEGLFTFFQAADRSGAWFYRVASAP